MIPRRIVHLVSGAYGKAALLGVLAIGLVLLPSPAAAQPPPTDTIVVLTGAGQRQTSRVQVGNQCTQGKQVLVVTEISGGGPPNLIIGFATCNSIPRTASFCSDLGGGMTNTCGPSTGTAIAGTPDCRRIYLDGNLAMPNSTWRVTCIFRA